MATEILHGPNNSYITDTTIQSGMIQNILSAQGKAKYPSAQIGCDVYKTVSPFCDFLRGIIEPNVGAHYYVMGPNSTTYTSASIEVPLSQCFVSGLSNANRRAFISMGIFTTGTRIKQCDVGLACDSDSGKWRAFCWCSGKKNTDVIKSKNVENISSAVNYIPDGKTVKILYSVGRTTKDWLKVEFFVDGDVFASMELQAARGEIFAMGAANTNPEVIFMRFMSLVPISNLPEDDNADNSALSATIHACTLYAGSTSVEWDKDKIWNAWAMQKSNIASKNNITELYISDIRSPMVAKDADYCRIYHQHQTH